MLQEVLENLMEKSYLGDGAYAKFDGYGIELTTEDGITTTNIIYLEPKTMKKLENLVEHIKAEIKKNT